MVWALMELHATLRFLFHYRANLIRVIPKTEGQNLHPLSEYRC